MHLDDDGFTLIELMVVVVVLTILVGLVLLGLQPFQSTSKAAACRSEIDSLRTANAAYRADTGANAPDADTLLANGYLARLPLYASIADGVTDPASADGCSSNADGGLALTPGTGVSGIAATATPAGGSGGWNTDVTLTVEDGAGNPVDGVEVVGEWSDGTNARKCTTGPDGTCPMHTHHDDATSSATWTLSTVGGEAGDNSVNAVTCTSSPRFGCS